MPAAAAEPPVVSLSFANNFWGKDDAGVVPLLGRMQASKQTCDELRSFYSARASLEDEYSRRLLALCRKPLGSQETGSLRASLDTLRGEVESMGRQHQNIAAQMKSELEEPLAAFSGGMKERRKIVQSGIEKLHKIKVQQTQQVNKTRDRYEQECLKIKGYLAQGHMVMGQEERKNKAKLEKTQISVATSNTEYENAVKALEDTTTRWNREWKAAADKFQDLEEERLDFTKSSLWQFANIASTVCVSDDASCEKIRLSLEKLEVETDIIAFIKDRGTGQEIPDAPKYINFCRGDMTDTQSEASEDDSYSVAQFPRSINPAFRSSSPQPSTYESHHDPNSILAHDLGHRSQESPSSRQASSTPRGMFTHPGSEHPSDSMDGHNVPPQTRTMPGIHARGPIAAVPHDPYPLDGMTMLCRTDVPSERSSQPNSARPGSRDSHSDYSNPTSMSSVEPLSAKTSPVKQEPGSGSASDKHVLKKRSGFFQNHSPFRRKSTKEVQPTNVGRNTWHSASVAPQGSPARRPQLFAKNTENGNADEIAGSPEPIDANATLALNVGQNVFNVSTPDLDRRTTAMAASRIDESDPIALALAELRGVSPDKQATARVSADRYHGIATPAPTSQPQFSKSVPPGTAGGSSVATGIRGTPPPSYDQPVQRLGVPQPAVTARAMKETSQKFAGQTRTMFGTSNRPGSEMSTYGNQAMPRTSTRAADIPRAVSPATPRSKSPRPGTIEDGRHHYAQSSSPSPGPSRIAPAQSWSPEQTYRQSSPNHVSSRSASPAHFRQYARSNTGHAQSDMAVQLATATDDEYGSQRSRGAGSGRPGTSSSSRAMGLYDGGGPVQGESRQRSKSVADPSRQYTSDGRPILHFAKALYVYQAAIPEELGFAKGDILAVLRHQDDGWWEAEIQGGGGRIGLVPSNYLQPC